MKKKIFVRGPVLSQSGYGEQSRFALRALRSREDLLDVYIQPVSWGKTGWVWDDSEFRQWMDERIVQTQIELHQKTLKPDISLQITIPNEFEKICPINFGYTAGIETNKCSPHWLPKCNEMDKVLVVSNHAKTSIKDTVAQAVNQQTNETVEIVCQKPVEVVWENTVRSEPEEIPGFNLDFDQNFLVVSQQGPRKNFENTVCWFVEEFIDQEVGLVIKTNIKGNSISDFVDVEERLKLMLNKYEDRKCKVYLLHGDLTTGQMTHLYSNPKISALINISHGEGFGLPIYEAAREGLPVIACGWSGHLDILHHNGKDYFQSVNFTIQPVQKEAVWKGVIEENTMWAFADQGSYKMLLRKTLKNLDKAKQTALELKELVTEKFSDDNLYDIFLKNFGIKPVEKTDYVFVSDFFKDQYLGGAELSLDVLIDSCDGSKSCINSSDLNFSHLSINKDSTWVFGNIAQLDEEIIRHVIGNDYNYYFVEFDYKFCEYRNPKLYEFLEEEECDYRSTEKGKLYTDFINGSLKTFFMSEGQKNLFSKHLNVEEGNLYVLSSLFDEEFFTKIETLQEVEKDDTWIVLGSRSWVKGAQQSEAWCKDNNLNYEVVNNLSYEEMLEKLAKSKGICFKPTGLDTCPRFVIEAKLLGCELELNENIQHLEEEWFKADTDTVVNYLKTRKDKFWELISD